MLDDGYRQEVYYGNGTVFHEKAWHGDGYYGLQVLRIANHGQRLVRNRAKPRINRIILDIRPALVHTGRAVVATVWERCQKFYRLTLPRDGMGLSDVEIPFKDLCF